MNENENIYNGLANSKMKNEKESAYQRGALAAGGVSGNSRRLAKERQTSQPSE
jgi:hypothetical protein